MNSYEISARLEKLGLGYNGDNSQATSSMLYLLDAARCFGIPQEEVWEALNRKHSLYGHVGHVYLDRTRSLWFILLDLEERQEHPGKNVCYTIRGPEVDPGYANGITEKTVLA